MSTIPRFTPVVITAGEYKGRLGEIEFALPDGSYQIRLYDEKANTIGWHITLSPEKFNTEIPVKSLSSQSPQLPISSASASPISSVSNQSIPTSSSGSPKVSPSFISKRYSIGMTIFTFDAKVSDSDAIQRVLEVLIKDLTIYSIELQHADSKLHIKVCHV